MSDALEPVLRELPRIWRLVRAGFVLRGPPALRILGTSELRIAERLAVEIAALAITKGVPIAARELLVRHAEAHGGVLTIEEPFPTGLPVLDAQAPDDVLDPPLDLDERARFEALVNLAKELVVSIDPRDRAIVEARARLEPPASGAWDRHARAVAESLKIAPARVWGREEVVRRHARHAAARRGIRAEDAEIEEALEAALGGAKSPSALPHATRERLERRIHTRVDLHSPPRSFGLRAAYAAGAVAIGIAAWAAMPLITHAAGPAPMPALTLLCSGEGCARATVSLRVPRPYRRAAIALVSADGSTRWIERSRARSQVGDLTLEGVELPPEIDRVVAVVSRDRLGSGALADVARGDPPRRGSVMLFQAVPRE